MRTKGELPTVGMRTYAGALGHGYSHFLRLPAVERHTPQLPELLSTLDPGVKDKSSVGTPSKAADFFGRACGRLDFEGDAFFFDPLARALYESGDLDKARKEYEKITLLTLGRLYHGDIYAKAFYMLGKIAEQQGDKAHARENYRKFLDLWKDADPGLPEVPDAKARLAVLEGIEP